MDFDVVSNPEFLKEGAAVGDFMKPDRIVVGTNSEQGCEDASPGLPALQPQPRQADPDGCALSGIDQVCRQRAAGDQDQFHERVANLAELYDADIEKVRIGIGSDPRIGYSFIYPGCGYGGSCFPKDVRALSRSAEQIGYQAELIDAVEAINNRQKEQLFDKDPPHFGAALKGQDDCAVGPGLQAQY